MTTAVHFKYTVMQLSLQVALPITRPRHLMRVAKHGMGRITRATDLDTNR
jgi:hypothetical protein